MSQTVMTARASLTRSSRGAVVGAVLLTLAPSLARCQISPQLTDEIRSGIANRIEALTILGGDFGLSAGHLTSRGTLLPGQGSSSVESDVTKGGGDGDVGDPQRLGDLDIGWQPRLQGNMGYLNSTNQPTSGLLAGDKSEVTTYAIEFGGGARFWLSDRLSVAPTLMGLYGDTSNSYTVRSAFMKANLSRAIELGLVDWRIKTWTLRPALNVQYVVAVNRAIITLSSDPTFFYTRGFNSSNSNVRINGDSGALANKIDVDVPLGIEIFGHELRSGGYLTRTELLGDLRSGLEVQHINEIHGRLVLDFLQQLWKVQWLGVGASYLWGTDIRGWTAGVDVAFRF